MAAKRGVKNRKGQAAHIMALRVALLDARIDVLEARLHRLEQLVFPVVYPPLNPYDFQPPIGAPQFTEPTTTVSTVSDPQWGRNLC